jgi:hypothetical protein
MMKMLLMALLPCSSLHTQINLLSSNDIKEGIRNLAKGKVKDIEGYQVEIVFLTESGKRFYIIKGGLH